MQRIFYSWGILSGYLSLPAQMPSLLVQAQWGSLRRLVKQWRRKEFISENKTSEQQTASAVLCERYILTQYPNDYT